MKNFPKIENLKVIIFKEQTGIERIVVFKI